MDPDVSLILLGAGISLASSIVTLILQFLFGLLTERMRERRAGKERQSEEIRAILMGKHLSEDIDKIMDKMFKNGFPSMYNDRSVLLVLGSLTTFFRTLPLWVGIVVFIIWIGFVVIR